MDDLISRKAVETAIKEFFKKQVDKLPKNKKFEEMFDLCGLFLELNVDLLNDVENIPAAFDVDKVAEQLQQKAWKTNTIQMPRYEAGKREAYYDAIDIVKGGGKDE